jgi:general secretion pathway protein D
MKTRSRTQVFTGLGIMGLLCSYSSFAQFQKYKSKTRFAPQQVQKVKPSPTNNFNNSVSAATDSDDRDTNTQTFGKRKSSGLIGKPKDNKFVNLNPETAFGPEVVTSFDFPDTDILELTRHMQSLTGINLILDKDVKGKVSITAPSAITVGDAWKAYLAALNMAGYTIVKSGAFYKVINARDVRYVPTKIYTGSYTPDTEAHMMKVIALKNVDASEISRNFRPFMSRYGRIIDIKQTNTIIISDTGSNIARLEKLIKFLDVPGYEETLQIIPVKNSSAQEIAKLLDEILKSQGSGGSTRSRSGSAASSSRFSNSSSTGGSNISKIIAEPRTNSIIAMANAAGAKQLRELINKLDVKLVSSSSERIHVHYLNYGSAEDLAKTLSTLVSASASANKSSSAASRRFIANGDDGNAIFNNEVKVTADKNNNALVVTASPTDWLTLKNVIAKLDIPRDQVYVEGLIMETSITRIRGFGVEFMGAYGRGNAQRAGFTTKGSGFTDLLSGNPLALSGFFAGFGGPEKSPTEFDIGGTTVKVNSVNGLVKAIASNSNTNVLATPQILAMDNTDAEFEVGTTVPVQRTTTATNGQTQTSVENQEAKLSLKITPQINKVTRFVKLKINQSINEFIGELDTSGNGAATTTRSAVTEVMVRDRDTIAMGGLLRDRETTSFSKVPLLGDIPVLGWLFKSKQRQLDKVNLLFFLTPKILSPYQNEAAKNSLNALKDRNEHLSEILDKDQEDPFGKRIEKVAKKLEKQQQGVMYDTSTPNAYQKNNDGAAPIQEIDYQKILEDTSNDTNED